MRPRTAPLPLLRETSSRLATDVEVMPLRRLRVYPTSARLHLAVAPSQAHRRPERDVRRNPQEPYEARHTSFARDNRIASTTPDVQPGRGRTISRRLHARRSGLPRPAIIAGAIRHRNRDVRSSPARLQAAAVGASQVPALAEAWRANEGTATSRGHRKDKQCNCGGHDGERGPTEVA